MLKIIYRKFCIYKILHYICINKQGNTNTTKLNVMKTSTKLAIEIIKLEGVEKFWNKKFYGCDNETIYVRNEKVNISSLIEELHENNETTQNVEEEYTRLRLEAYKAGVDAMMSGGKENREKAYADYINELISSIDEQEEVSETETEIRELNDGSILTVTTSNNEYFAKISTDTKNIGFEDDCGELKGGENCVTIADQLACWMNENLTC